MSYLNGNIVNIKMAQSRLILKILQLLQLTLVPQIRDCNRQAYIAHASKPWGKWKTRVQLKAAIGITYSRSGLCSIFSVFVYNLNRVTVAGCNQKIF